MFLKIDCTIAVFFPPSKNVSNFYLFPLSSLSNFNLNLASLQITLHHNHTINIYSLASQKIEIETMTTINLILLLFLFSSFLIRLWDVKISSSILQNSV